MMHAGITFDDEARFPADTTNNGRLPTDDIGAFGERTGEPRQYSLRLLLPSLFMPFVFYSVSIGDRHLIAQIFPL